MDFLTFLDVRIELRNSSQSQFIHQVDLKGILEPAQGEILHGDGESG